MMFQDNFDANYSQDIPFTRHNARDNGYFDGTQYYKIGKCYFLRIYALTTFERMDPVLDNAVQYYDLLTLSEMGSMDYQVGGHMGGVCCIAKTNASINNREIVWGFLILDQESKKVRITPSQTIVWNSEGLRVVGNLFWRSN